MKALLNPLRGDILLVIAPHAGGALMFDLIARLACRGALRVLDSGNRFDAYHCNRAIARALDADTARLPAILAHIHLARAFTCYQMVTLLKETPAQPSPTIVLDLLSTFYDESVPAAESLRLLERCIAHLQRLNLLAPVVVSIRPRVSSSHLRAEVERPQLVETLRSAVGQVVTLEPHAAPPQPRLW